MTDLQSKLEEHWPPHSIIVKCDVCDRIFFDSRKETPAIEGPSYFAYLINDFASIHARKTGHKDVDVEINKQPTAVSEIDVTVTIND